MPDTIPTTAIRGSQGFQLNPATPAVVIDAESACTVWLDGGRCQSAPVDGADAIGAPTVRQAPGSSAVAQGSRVRLSDEGDAGGCAGRITVP